MKIDSVTPLRILMVASECSPLAKTGGLGDMVAGLSQALAARGHDVRILLPLYGSIDRQRFGVGPATAACVHMGGNAECWVGVRETTLGGRVPVWLLEHDGFFGRPGTYNEHGVDYADNPQRFALLCKTALQLCKDRAWIPHVMHLHDWQTAPTAALLKTWDKWGSPLSATATVLTIHNIGYQGKYGPSAFSFLGIGAEHFSPDAFEDHGGTNLLKGGIHFADAITTVSPTHAQEIRTPEGGWGLAPYLNNRSRDFIGILNGIDTREWDPSTDAHLAAHFSVNDLTGKAACKAALQRELGLPVRADVPLFGVVSRFVMQKGFSLAEHVLPAALEQMDFQVAALGSGDGITEAFFRILAARRPDRVACRIGFSEPLAHRIEAGADVFLMPSLYEPCGLNQMYSLRYGALPLVRATGGLDDTVENYDERTGAGTGFKFYDATPQALHDTIGWAVSTWYDRPKHFAAMRARGMQKDFSWEKSAEAYERIYINAPDRWQWG